MAKSSSFFGLRTGSTKSLTFSTYRGKQITKDRVTSVANPQSAAQMDQRLLLPLVANARTRLSGLVDHSFEGVPYGYQSLQRFSSLNLAKDALKVAAYVPKGLSLPGLANFIIADGSLTNYLGDCFLSDSGESYFNVGFEPEPAAKIWPAMPKGTKGSTVMYYFARYAKSATSLSFFSANSQLTFLGQVEGDDVDYTASDGSTQHTFNSIFGIMRIVCPDSYPADTTPGTPLTVNELAGIFDDNDQFVLADAVAEGGANIVRLVQSKTGLSIQIGFKKLTGEDSAEFRIIPNFTALSSSGNVPAVGAIYSKKEGNIWRRSRSRMTILETGNSKMPTREQVIAGYLKPTSSSKKYLNSGTEGTGLVGSK